MKAAVHAQGEIPSREVEFHPMSFIDDSGRLFFWRGQLYRAVRADYARFLRKEFSPAFRPLVDKGWLVETSLTDLTLPGWDLVLSHASLPYVTHPFEWPRAMLRAATLLVLDLELELARNQLTTIDAHPWNVVFDGTSPRYVDITSIAAWKGEVWRSLDLVNRFCLFPLALMAEGKTRVARSLMQDHENGLREREFTALASRTLRMRYFAFRVRRKLVGLGITSRSTLLRYLRSSIPDFSGGNGEALDRQLEADRVTSLERIVDDLRPRTALCFGETGWRDLRSLCKRIPFVISINSDENVADAVYTRAKAQELALLSVVMNPRNPTPGYGPCQAWMPDASARLRTEVVFAPASLLRFVAERTMLPEHVAALLASFATRACVVECSKETGERLQGPLQKHFGRVSTEKGFLVATEKR